MFSVRDIDRKQIAGGDYSFGHWSSNGAPNRSGDLTVPGNITLFRLTRPRLNTKENL
jgi:hypothetical protein